MKKILSNNYTLVILSALLLTPPWYEWGTGFFAMLGLVPLLFLIERLLYYPDGGRRILLLSSLTFIIWNLFTTWWLKNASIAGVIAAILISTVLQSFAIWLTFKVRKAFGYRAGLLGLVVFWMAHEFAFMHGEISWPWLNFGHAFAFEPKLIQWYEYTGVFGGSLWILIMNVSLFEVIRNWDSLVKNNITRVAVVAGILLVPVVISLVKYHTYEEKDCPRKIIVVQPNMDPYLKFNDIAPIEHARTQIFEAEKLIDSTVDFVVTPETSLLGNFWIGSFEQVGDVHLIKQLVDKYPDCNYVAGIVCRKLYEPGDSIPESAHPYNNQGLYYEYYNSAISIDTTDNIQLYHKSQLVTGIEKMPYKRYLKFLKKAMVNLGGTFRGNATQPDREVFTAINDTINVAPVICWESVFGDYVTDYVKKGAHYIFIITNDGWWGNTPGHRQHNSLASIRAIETRRSIARSANTGISSFVNQRGDMLQTLGWWKRGALIDEINANSKITFYVKHGDYLGRVSFLLAGFMILFLIAKAFGGAKKHS